MGLLKKRGQTLEIWCRWLRLTVIWLEMSEMHKDIVRIFSVRSATNTVENWRHFELNGRPSPRAVQLGTFVLP